MIRQRAKREQEIQLIKNDGLSMIDKTINNYFNCEQITRQITKLLS